MSDEEFASKREWIARIVTRAEDPTDEQLGDWTSTGQDIIAPLYREAKRARDAEEALLARVALLLDEWAQRLALLERAMDAIERAVRHGNLDSDEWFDLLSEAGRDV